MPQAAFDIFRCLRVGEVTCACGLSGDVSLRSLFPLAAADGATLTPLCTQKLLTATQQESVQGHHGE